MMNNEPVFVINNPESIVEVFVDTKADEVVERKRLNYNRYKTYTYSTAEYLARNKHNERIYESILAAVN